MGWKDENVVKLRLRTTKKELYIFELFIVKDFEK
jgi:hypothetical protein